MANPNEAFVREVQSDHLELEHLARDLRGSVESGERESWTPAATAKLIDALTKMSVHLDRHFASEEEGGYMEEALAIAPRFGHQASQLLKQHAMLNQSVHHLATAAQRSKDSREHWPRIGEQTLDLLKKLEAHEAAENRIMGEAFNVDLELKEPTE